MIPWNATFAIQTAFGPAPACGHGAHFPAQSAHLLSRRAPRRALDPTRPSSPRRSAAATALWNSEELRDVGPNSIAFLTHIEPRGLPLDWRVKLNYVQADYTAGGATLYSLRPARYITDPPAADALAHAWMLPEAAVQRLRDAHAQLELTYSLTLLKPREYSVPTDGKRHALPGLGYCSAKVDEPGNRIDVDCFSAFAPSRADQRRAERDPREPRLWRACVDFAPACVQWPYGQHVKLAIGSPRLATARQHHGHRVGCGRSSPEVPDDCPASWVPTSRPARLPTTEAIAFRNRAGAMPRRMKPTPSRVDEGVQLEVLDFGGTGSPILLLPGLGATAHSFDELAPLLAREASRDRDDASWHRLTPANPTSASTRRVSRRTCWR